MMSFKKWLIESDHYDDYIRAIDSHNDRMKEYKVERDKYDSARHALEKEHAEEIWAAANRAWDAGKSVFFNTTTKMYEIKPKNRDALRLVGRAIEVARGKNWDSLRGQGMQTMAKNLGLPLYANTEHLESPDEPEKPDEPHAHLLTPDQYVRMKGGEEFWRDVHKQAVENELDRGLVSPEHMSKVSSLYPDLIAKVEK